MFANLRNWEFFKAMFLIAFLKWRLLLVLNKTKQVVPLEVKIAAMLHRDLFL